MYKIYKALFGYNYIAWKNLADSGIARVFKAGDGKVCYWRYKVTKVLDIVETPSQVTWLTCPSSYYFPSGDLITNLKNKPATSTNKTKGINITHGH